jgi:hypothetical protein
MREGGKVMKLLSISDNGAQYLDGKGEYRPIDKIGKEDLLRLVNLTLHEEVVEFDEYNDKALKNQAHQIIYKSIVQKLRALRNRRQEFIDESARLFLEDYEKYRDDSRK